MKVVDHVNSAIKTYPRLFLGRTYEESKIAALHQAFIVLGNGLEWAYTKDPRKGGYITNPVYKENKDGEYVRKYDKPYGKVKFPLDTRFFTEKVYSFDPIDKKLSEFIGAGGKCESKSETVFESDLIERKNWVYQGTKDFPDTTEYVAELVSGEDKTRNPYPNFEKTYSCFWEDDVQYIQDDWLAAAIEHMEYWLVYFNDDTKTNDYHRRYKEETVEEIIKAAKEQSNGKDWVAVIRKNCDWPTFDDSKTNKENADNHWYTIELPNTKKFIEETLSKLRKILSKKTIGKK